MTLKNQVFSEIDAQERDAVERFYCTWVIQKVMHNSSHKEYYWNHPIISHIKRTSKVSGLQLQSLK